MVVPLWQRKIKTIAVMKKLALFLALLIPIVTLSQIINIPTDYPAIQQGIDAAADGDTVLVDTGTYVENLNFNGKNITVASHYLMTLDTSYISQTVIDGDSSGSVVPFVNGEDSTALLCGFTIQNGSGVAVGEDTYYFMGGGIYCVGANPTFKNLIITDNHAGNYGGGMFIELSQSALENVCIKNNSSLFGGGIYLGYGADIIFDSIALCSMYLNQATIGNDIYSNYPVEVFLDTFSVSTPTGFYATPFRNFSFNIFNGLTELIDEDVYVSPEGDNNNDGLSEENAFKTIHHAFSKVRADSLHRNTVHLLSGTYSIDSEEIFPIYIPDYTYLKGEDKNTVILDGENAPNLPIVYFKLNEFVQMSDLTLINGSSFDDHIYGGGIHCSQANPILKDLIITECQSFEGSAIYLRDNSNAKLIRIDLIDFNGGGWGGILSSWDSNVCMEDCVIANNNDNRIIDLIGSVATLTNVLINNNESGVISSQLSELNIINSTLTNNTDGSSGIISYNSFLNLENTILWNNYPTEISFGEDLNGNDTLFVSYSNIQGGEQGIIINDSTTIYWIEGNIDQDPLFVGSGDHPYQINDYSPCIDAGTPDTTGLNLPEYDLAGEVRIFNDRVDMGAYEWNTFVGTEDASMPDKNTLQVNKYPNPFNTSTTIEYELKQPETIRVTFYNQFGKQMEVIEESQSQGLNKVVWIPGTLSDGIYYYRLKAGEQVASGKLVKMD